MERILVIDDEVQILTSLRSLLQCEGYEVLTASNGKEGTALCNQEPIDIVITDIVMPEKDGMETIVELRRDFPKIKIIAMSGGNPFGHKNVLNLARTLGARCLLYKPFSRDDVLKAIRETIDHDS